MLVGAELLSNMSKEVDGDCELVGTGLVSNGMDGR